MNDFFFVLYIHFQPVDSSYLSLSHIFRSGAYINASDHSVTLGDAFGNIRDCFSALSLRLERKEKSDCHLVPSDKPVGQLEKAPCITSQVTSIFDARPAFTQISPYL